ncbi:hypothetical protein ACFL0P_05045 [Candidatus Omnitrophota bacterium]
MRDNVYNLNVMPFPKGIFIVLVLFSAFNFTVLAENVDETISERVGTITDESSSWYAIAKIDGKKRKLCTKGDIFYSGNDTTKCLRIHDIKKNELVLKYVNSENSFTLKPGEKIPLEGPEIIFEKTIEQDIVEYRYRSSKESDRDRVRDLTIKSLRLRKINM